MTHSTNLEDKWSAEILDHGYTVIPNLLIKNISTLNINPSELMVLLVIEMHRWDKDHPWPSVKTISDITGLGVRQVGRITSELEEMNLLIKLHRDGRSCRYDMTPLVNEINNFV